MKDVSEIESYVELQSKISDIQMDSSRTPIPEGIT